MHHIPGTHGGQKMPSDPLEAESQVRVSHHWESNSGPPEKWQVLLAAEPSPQSGWCTQHDLYMPKWDWPLGNEREL